MGKTVRVMDYIPSALWPGIEAMTFTDDVSAGNDYGGFADAQIGNVEKLLGASGPYRSYASFPAV